VNKRIRYQYNNEPIFKIKEIVKKRIKNALTSEEVSWLSVTELRQYFEYNHFQEEGKEWMRWDNWGGKRFDAIRSWELDHIMPISSFDLSDEEEVKKCFHWSNLQPLSWQDNA
jgi:hypothetical protein